MNTITYDDFLKVDFRVGTVLTADVFPEARKPAYKLTIDFGEDIWIKKTSAQITALYTPEQLVWKQVVAVVNFPPKQIWPFMSECLVTWFSDKNGDIVLISPEMWVENWERLH